MAGIVLDHRRAVRRQYLPRPSRNGPIGGARPTCLQSLDQRRFHLHDPLVMHVSDQIRLEVPRYDTEGSGTVTPTRVSAQNQLPQESGQLLRNVLIERVTERFLSMEVVKLRDKSARSSWPNPRSVAQREA